MEENQKPKNIFVSHEAASINEAVKLKELLLSLNKRNNIFLSSDWESLETGNTWMSDIIKALQKMNAMIVLITSEATFRNLWVNFEIGAAIGRKIKPKIIVFSGVSFKDIPYPINGLHLIGSGDTNRWVNEFKNLGYEIFDIEPFSKLLENRN